MSKQNPTRYMVIMRHGDQCPRNGLTEKGKDQVKITAQALETEGLTPDILITSYSERAKLSASILSAHFNVAVSRTTELLNVLDESFKIENFLQSLPQEPQIIALSGHDETMQCFGHFLLSDHDTVQLFHLLPENRILEIPKSGYKSLHAMGGHADALILHGNGNDWNLYGWLANGQIKRAGDMIDPDRMLEGASKSMEVPDRPDLTIKLPDQPEPCKRPVYYALISVWDGSVGLFCAKFHGMRSSILLIL